MTSPLTQRQEEVLEAIRVVTARLGYAPSHRDLCVELGIQSTNAVSDHLLALEKRGRIARTPGVPRSLRVVDPPESRIGAPGSWAHPRGMSVRSSSLVLLAACIEALVETTPDELLTIACLAECPPALEWSGVLGEARAKELAAAVVTSLDAPRSAEEWKRALHQLVVAAAACVVGERIVAGPSLSSFTAHAWATSRARFVVWCWREHRDRLGMLLVRDALTTTSEVA